MYTWNFRRILFFAVDPLKCADGFYEAENSFVVILSNENRFEVDASCRTFLQFMGKKTEYQRPMNYGECWEKYVRVIFFVSSVNLLFNQNFNKCEKTATPN